MRRALLTICLLAVLAGAAWSQEPVESQSGEFDPQLAAKLGADDYGMRNYVFVLLKTGTADTADAEARQVAFSGHFTNMKKMADAGKLVLAGPFADDTGVKRGLFIFNVTTLEDARQLVESDPAVKAGYLDYELTKWYGSAALMQVSEIHRRIAKKPI